MEPKSVISGISAMNAKEENFPWASIKSYEDTLNNNSINYLGNTSGINTISNESQENNKGIINPPKDLKFVHNNMVPFFRGNGTGQSMESTGISQGNINYDKYNTGTDNLTPNYSKLATFTGSDNTYLHKREVPGMFSPTERLTHNTIPGKGADSERPNLDRYKTSILHKNEQKPFESIQVGPGIAIDASEPNDGQGFNAGLSTQIKPNNYNSYRLHQFPGRITGTKSQVGELPTALPGFGPSFSSYQNSLYSDGTSNAIDKNGNINTEKLINDGSLYGVPSKKPSLSTLSTLDRREMIATPSMVQAQTLQPNIILPSATNKKQSTNVGFGESLRNS